MRAAAKTLAKVPDQIAVRTSPELVERADAMIAFLSGLRGVQVTRSDVYREALVRGLRDMEREERKTADER